MANLVRLRGLQGLLSRAGSLSSSSTSSSTGSLLLTAHRRCVGTSGSQKTDVPANPAKNELATWGEVDTPGVKKGCWVSFGFSDESQWEDRHMLHVWSFFGISMLMVGGSFIIIYLPDHRYRDWAQREAYLVLRQREAAGLPPIDRDLIDPAKVKLPPDEILKNEDIII